jgi:alkylated DNA repair dioxygenase AlkB
MDDSTKRNFIRPNQDTIMENQHWVWVNLLDHPTKLYNELFSLLDDKCVRGQWQLMGMTVPEPKRSIVVEDKSSKVLVGDDHSETSINVEPHKSYDWEEIPILRDLGIQIYQALGILVSDDELPFDYCLVNIYDDGKDGIGWHADEEAGIGDIISVSLGCERIFAFRPKDKKNNGGRAKKKTIKSAKGKAYTIYETEWTVKMPFKSGHVVHMKEGCQQALKHTLCKTTSKTEAQTPRINLTYRKHFQS